MDRAEAIEILSERVSIGGTVEQNCMIGFGVNVDRLDDALDMAIAALREQEQSKWISVKEKPMPEGNEEYEVCCNYHDKKRIEIHKGWNTYCVTHWRKLPEPPKEGADHE